MKKVFMIHGFEGSPNGGWRPWLMGELAKLDIYACSLPMPTPEAPQKDAWVQTIADAVGTPSEGIILVGHSLGVPAILRYLETLPKGSKIGGTVLVGGSARMLEGKEDRPYAHFLTDPFDFEKIKNSCKAFSVIHGDDDPVVPFSDAEYLGEQLSCPVIPIPHGGHLNGSSGWLVLPEAKEEILKMI